MKKENTKFEIDLTINKLVAAFENINNSVINHENEIKDLLIKKNNNDDLINIGLMLSEVHVIDCIGKNQLPNATFISKELNMTKGAISKISGKLLKKELIKANRLANNKKEIFYTLTNRGKEIFEAHEILHKAEHEKFVTILSQYNKEELIIINSFLDNLISE